SDSGDDSDKCSCEESWRPISSLWEKLPATKVQTIVRRCSLPSSGKKREPLRVYQILQRRRAKHPHWLTLADLKMQAVKEICYEVALNDFRHSRQEIEAMSIVKMKELCHLCGRHDPSERESWRAVARDIWDTVGVGEAEGPMPGGSPAPGNPESRANLPGVEVGDLQAHIDKLTDILQEVKIQNNVKDQEIRAAAGQGGEDGAGRQRAGAGVAVAAVGAGVPSFAARHELREAPQEEGSLPCDQVSRLMKKDPAFRRGHLRWLRQTAFSRPPSQLPQHRGPSHFIPPQDCKLRFPVKSNPQHRYSWGPSTAFMVGEEKEEPRGGGDPSHSSPTALPKQPARRHSLEGGPRGRRNKGRGQEQHPPRKHNYYPCQHQPYPQRRSGGLEGYTLPACAGRDWRPTCSRRTRR
ncbi:hypothetical protein E2320_022486, partial [Naja naja]